MTREIIKRIETDLTLYDQIVLIKNDTDAEMELAGLFLTFAASRQISKKVLILSYIDSLECNGVWHRQISKEEENSILEIYNMYEFSNRVSIISQSDHFGNLINYFETGVLTLEEMFDAILQ